MKYVWSMKCEHRVRSKPHSPSRQGENPLYKHNFYYEIKTNIKLIMKYEVCMKYEVWAQSEKQASQSLKTRWEPAV